MPETLLVQSIAALSAATKMPANEAVGFLFDHYRTSQPEAQDALVLALIGEVISAQTRRTASAATSRPEVRT